MNPGFFSYLFTNRVNIGSIVLATMAAVLVFSISWIIDKGERERFRQHVRANAVEHTSAIRAKLEGELNAHLHLAYGLAAFRNTEPAHLDEDFALYARALMDVGLKGIRSLQLAPNAVVTYVFPIEGNEEAIGHDLLADPKRGAAVQKTIDDKIFLIAGPFELVQGGEALVARLPIYNPTLDGAEIFWGFATVVLDFAPIIDASGISGLQDRYLVALRGKDAMGAEGAVFYGAENIFQADPVVQNITLPYGAWQIALIPKHGWPSSAPVSPWLLGGGIVLALLTAWIVLMMMGMTKDFTESKQTNQELARYRDQLEEMVEERTAKVQEQALQLEHALESEKEYSALQQKFVSLVSHEFRTPLTIIDGTAQRLARAKTTLPPAALREKSETIRAAVGRMTDLIENTLYAARLEEGVIEMHPTDIDLAEMLCDFGVLHGEIAPDHDINVDVTGLQSTIMGDEKLLGIAFTNLISNAIKFSPQAARIEVNGWEEGDTVVVAVADQGVGIPEGELPHMFERFFRAKTAEGIKGTGIGLNVSKEFVEMHGGTIQVASVEGEGSTFTVRLPIRGQATA